MPAVQTPAEAVLSRLIEPADIRINGTRPWDVRVRDERLYSRVLDGGSLALGEAYMDGWWDCDDLPGLFFRILRSGLYQQAPHSPGEILEVLRSKLFNPQTKTGVKQVAYGHYDLGNDLFTAFLDPYRQYSCGYFRNTDDLAVAQRQKLDLLCRKLQLSSADHLLDIGCGWGGLAKFAAQHYGCRVTGITISKPQAEYAREFCKGVPVDIQLRDYRDVQGTFSKVISVGMFEHVGEKNYAEFMRVVDRVLTDDGLFLLHTMGCNEHGSPSDPWITRYIFPNSMIPSPLHIAQATDRVFRLEDWHNFGPDYAKTLHAWRENFVRHWPSIRHKYDQRFYRMWIYYLSSFEGGFSARALQLWQMVWAKPERLSEYQSIR